MEKILEKLHSEKMAAALAVQSSLLHSLSSSLYREGFVQLMPVMLSPITDPLCHSVYEAKIDYLGRPLQLTKSMILHKQIAVSSPRLPKIFIISPNVRLEKPSCAASGRHLIEFSQIDIEMRGAKSSDFMALMERLLRKAFSDVEEECGQELAFLGRRLPTLSPSPFPVFQSKKCRAQFGDDFEAVLSNREPAPFWITDHAREFYDKEDELLRGHYLNYDLIYPEGFGEALSGGERDYHYSALSRKMAERGQDERQFGTYMDFAKSGILAPSVGGGIGVERLVRYICGFSHVADASPFAKVPGVDFTL